MIVRSQFLIVHPLFVRQSIMVSYRPSHHHPLPITLIDYHPFLTNSYYSSVSATFCYCVLLPVDTSLIFVKQIPSSSNVFIVICSATSLSVTVRYLLLPFLTIHRYFYHLIVRYVPLPVSYRPLPFCHHSSPVVTAIILHRSTSSLSSVTNIVHWSSSLVIY